MLKQLNDQLAVLEGLTTRAANYLGGDLDEEQVELYDLAFSAAELLAARTALQHAEIEDALLGKLALQFAAETVANVSTRLLVRPSAYGLSSAEIPTDWQLDEVLGPRALADTGARVRDRGLPEIPLDDDKRIMRDTFREFATEVVQPLAEGIHRNDALIPDEILDPLKAMGCFGLSVPERYEGLKPDAAEDSLGMVVVTDELSRGSLGAAGSLITRPEIMSRALLEGGSEAQKQRWLPGIAKGEPLCAIAVTEPNTGSDVASVNLRATRADGGWRLSGGKTWCTFAGKAGTLLVLARTDAEVVPKHRGLSLFVVEKPSHQGHDFDYAAPNGGRLTGRAISTLGYRGMHSFELFFDDLFVPDDCLVGEAGGVGKGFYYTMRGFMGGRLQTAARACGVMNAAFDSALAYSSDRRVFDRAVADYPLSLAKLGRMASYITVCRLLTYRVAALMDAGAGAMEASLVKLLACKAAEWVTREALQLHGGMGYAEESAVSRYFADARVLSIFEGAEETLAIRVVGKALIEAAQPD